MGRFIFSRLVVNVILVCLIAPLQADAQFTQQGSKLVGTGAVGSPVYQGTSVALSSDGNTAIVGGHSDNGNAGAAWVWTRSGGVWAQQGSKLVGTGPVGPARQGESVSLSPDGNTAIVSGPNDSNNTGAVWVWTRLAGVWTQQGNKLVSTDALGPSSQGTSVSLSSDGNTAIVGGNGDNGTTGAAWVWIRSGGVWTQQGSKLVGTGAVGSAFQGQSISLSSDGNTAIVGGFGDNGNTGAAWVWTRSGGVWTQQGSKLVGTGALGATHQGISVALSSDGNTAIVGGYGDNGNTGAAWVFTRSAGVWSQQGSKLVGAGAVGAADQGISVAVSHDGNTALVAGHEDSGSAGAAWVWTRSAGVWTQSGAKLVGTGAAGNANHGSAVSLSSDGNTAIVGGPNDNGSLGAAWIYATPNILLSVDSVSSRVGDTVTVPVRVTFPSGKNYSSSEVTLGGFKDNLQFLRLDTNSTLIGAKGWSYQQNGNDSVVITASAGANDISGTGILFKAQFRVLSGGCLFIPINIQSALFNTGTENVARSSGGVDRKAAPTYGDVDKNGQIQAADASKILKYLVGKDSLICQSLANADVTNNGSVSGLDATAILKYVVHLITSFPADSTTMGSTSAQGVIAMYSSIPSPLGSVVEIPLNLSQGKNILSFDGTLKFSPSDLSWKKVIWSSSLSGFNIEITVDSTIGTVRFAGAGSLPGGNSGKFASFFFAPKKNGMLKVSLEELRWNEEKKMTNVGSTSIVTSVERYTESILTDYSLGQNYPNPFNPSTTIRYGLPNRSSVRLVITNTLGQEVAVLTNGEKEPGYHEVEWNANVASGIYFYRIDVASTANPNDRFIQVKKMLLLK